jgi:hypothetical protein
VFGNVDRKKKLPFDEL